MNMQKLKILMLVFFVGLVGCTHAEVSQTKQIQIGISYYDSYDPFIEQLSKRIEDILNEENVVVKSQDSEKSQIIQNRQVSDMLKDGYDVICVNLVDRTAPKKIITMAEEANVPIIFFNRELVAQDLESWKKLYYVGGDANESGTKQGEIVVSYLESHPEADHNLDGKIQYIVMEGEAGHQDAIVRTESSIQAISDAGVVLDKLDYAIANWNRSQAYTKMKQFLGKYKDSVELVLCNNDEMALGVVQALSESDIPQSQWPLIIGVDGLLDGLKEVKNGTMIGTVYNDQIGQAEAIAQLAIALAKNEDLDQCHLTNGKYIRKPYEKVTQENVDDYLKLVQ